MLNLMHGFVKQRNIDLVLVKGKGRTYLCGAVKGTDNKFRRSATVAKSSCPGSYLRRERPPVLLSVMEDTSIVAL